MRFDTPDSLEAYMTSDTPVHSLTTDRLNVLIMRPIHTAMKYTGSDRCGIRSSFESLVEPSGQTNERLDRFWLTIIGGMETRTEFASVSAMLQGFRCCLFRAIRDYKSGRVLTKGQDLSAEGLG